MKGEIRKRYQEFVNHIDFPAIIYVYENNRIMAQNSYSNEIVGHLNEDIRELFEGKKMKFPKDLVKGGSKLYLNVGIVTCKNERINIDMDINIFKVDSVHFILMLFESSLKNIFVGQLSIQVPRVSWSYIGSNNIILNNFLKNDIRLLGGDTDNLDFFKILDEATAKKVNEIGNRIVEYSESQYNSIQMITTSDKNSSFIKVHRMPIINNAGDVIGILSVHVKILSREKHRALFDTALKSNTMVSEIIDKGDTIFISWLSDENSTVQYVSPNITRYGYSVEEFCSGKINFKDIIYNEDYAIIQCKFKPKDVLEEADNKSTDYEYRIKKADGEIVWVHEECTPVVLNSSIVYNFSSLQDITSRKKLEEELNKRKKEYQLKKERLVIAKDIDFKMFKLEELFDFDDIKGVLKLLSEVMYLTCFITDTTGKIISNPVSTVKINDELIRLINSRRCVRKYKEAGERASKIDNVVTEDFCIEGIKMSTIPFCVGEAHLGNLIVIAVIENPDALEINMSERNNRKFLKYFEAYKLFINKSIRDYIGIINFLTEHIKCMCKAEYHNIELIKEKDNLQKTANQLQFSYGVLESVLDNIDSCIFVITHGEYIIRFANKKMKNIYGEEIVGSDLFAFLIGHSIESCTGSDFKYNDINIALDAAQKCRTEISTSSRFYDNENKKYLSTKVENISWIDGEKALLVTMNDITYAERIEDRNRNVYIDFLTGLPNRKKYEIDAKQKIMNAIENNKNGAVIMFDLDDFKHINYRYGHDFGENFIKEVARKIKANPDIKDCTYRCRGVEFIVILDSEKEDEIERISEDIMKLFKSSWNVNGEEIYCSLSMGITAFPRDGINPMELIKNADIAMYEAKKMDNSMKVYYKEEKYMLTIKC